MDFRVKKTRRGGVIMADNERCFAAWMVDGVFTVLVKRV